jgi:hypothetical protein
MYSRAALAGSVYVSYGSAPASGLFLSCRDAYLQGTAMLTWD